MKKVLVSLVVASTLLTGCGSTVALPPNAMTEATQTQNVKALFQDPMQRFVLNIPVNCPLTAILRDKDKNSDELLPAQKIAVDAPTYKDWFEYDVLSKQTYDQYMQKYNDGMGQPSNHWVLNDGSYLITFSPQEGPDNVRDCPISVVVK